MNKDFGKRVAISSVNFEEPCPEPSDEILQLLEKMEKGIIKRATIPADAINQFIEQLNTDDSWIEFAKEDLLLDTSVDKEGKEENKYIEQNKPQSPLLSHDNLSPILPPRRFQYFLDLILPNATREYMIGCLQEEYETRILPMYGKRAADNWYRIQVAKSIVQILWSAVLRVTFITWLGKGFESLYKKHLQ